MMMMMKPVLELMWWGTQWVFSVVPGWQPIWRRSSPNPLACPRPPPRSSADICLLGHLWFWNGALSCSYNQHHYHLHHLGNPPSGRMLLWPFGSSLCKVLESWNLWQFRHTVLLGQESLDIMSNRISLSYLFNALLEVSPACMGEQIWDRRCKLKLFKTCAKQDFIHQLIVFKL